MHYNLKCGIWKMISCSRDHLQEAVTQVGS